MYQIDPTADAAVGVAYMYYKKGDYENAVKYFDEALAKETDNDKKAEMAYATAAALMQAKNSLRQEHIARRLLALRKTMVILISCWHSFTAPILTGLMSLL